MRFHSPDSLSPFGEGGLNAYAYGEGDSVNGVDPTGHWPSFSAFKGLRKFLFGGKSNKSSSQAVSDKLGPESGRYISTLKKDVGKPLKPKNNSRNAAEQARRLKVLKKKLPKDGDELIGFTKNLQKGNNRRNPERDNVFARLDEIPEGRGSRSFVQRTFRMRSSTLDNDFLDSWNSNGDGKVITGADSFESVDVHSVRRE